MNSVLFVDDEENILMGLKRSLRSLRNEWQMEFCNSGEESLRMMESQSFDVIVSDIRMPGMDGVQLLLAVKDKYPETIRIALSGHAETELELECARAAHQFLAKPAEADEIKAAVDAASRLKLLLEDEGLLAMIGSVDALPSIPELYQQIMEEAADPNGSIVKVGDIISQDLAMSAKILQLVNSAFFGLSREVDSVVQAVNLLGFDIIKSLVLAQKVFSQYENTITSGLNLEQLMRQCNRVAALARKIAQGEGLSQKLCDQTVMAGMLHNVGKLIFADRFPDRYAKVIERVNECEMSFRDAELAEFGISHEIAGGYLLGIWGLPAPVVEAVTYHHTPSDAIVTEFTPLTAIYLANIIIHAMDQELADEELMDYLDINYINKISNLGKVNDWVALNTEMDAAA